MKKLVYLLVLVVSSSVFGQLTKEQQKAVSKQMKSQTPEQYLQTQQDLEDAKKRAIELEEQVELLEGEKEQLEAEINDYQATTSAKKETIAELEKLRHEAEVASARYYKSTQAYNAPVNGSSSSSSSASSSSSSTASSSAPVSGGYGSYKKAKAIPGLVYKVQIGAYKGYDIREYFNRHENSTMTVDEDGLMRYTLGVFQDYWEADKFKAYLRKMGVKGAWVVAYKDGNRVSIKDAREGNL